MNKPLAIIYAALLSFSTAAQGSEETESDGVQDDGSSFALADAPKEAIDAATSICHSWASDDEIEEQDRSAYLLACVNDELQLQGYAPVSSISTQGTLLSN